MIETLLGSSFLYACLYVSLGICCAGILFKAGRWFIIDTGPASTRVPRWQRFTAAMRSMLSALAGRRALRLFRLILLEGLLQTRILKTSAWRWVMHASIFVGFTMLVLMHAIDEKTTKVLFPDYYSTLDPFQFLRNLFGAIVLFGVAIAVIRRLRFRKPILVTRRSDRIAVAIVSVIIATGFVLEAVKLTSARVYQRMAEAFYPSPSPEDDNALKAYWSKEYGTTFASWKVNITPELLARGKQIHEETCASCHSNAASAFISHPIARAVQPFASALDRHGVELWLYYLHVFACFAALAYFPFSKLFHIITNPLSIIINGMSDKKVADNPAAAPRRALELDACTSCGTCNRHCSVAPVYRMLGNLEILPFQKLCNVKALATGKMHNPAKLQEVSEGAFICTTCYRCTEVCPAGINLQDQWFASRALLAEKGFPQPHVWIKEKSASEWSDRIRHFESGVLEVDTIKGRYYNLTDDSEVFAPCIQCQTCTNVCPVVAARGDSRDAVDISPQKIMNLLRLGLNDLAMGSRMVWDCLTCYQCQEHCPQGIRVTDIIYELKNRAYLRFREMDRWKKVDEDAS